MFWIKFSVCLISNTSCLIQDVGIIIRARTYNLQFNQSIKNVLPCIRKLDIPLTFTAFNLLFSPIKHFLIS